MIRYHRQSMDALKLTRRNNSNQSFKLGNKLARSFNRKANVSGNIFHRRDYFRLGLNTKSINNLTPQLQQSRLYSNEKSDVESDSTQDSKLNSVLTSRDDWYGREAGSSSPTLNNGVRTAQDYIDLVEDRQEEIVQLPEYVEFQTFIKNLKTMSVKDVYARFDNSFASAERYLPREVDRKDGKIAFDAALMASVLHLESRVSSFIGQGFYTIGPAGEELLSSVGCLLQEQDFSAFHYRHLSCQIARQLKGGKPINDVLLDRARGHCVSANDPITGGVHCSIGGNPTNDFIVTSTLSSQAPPAVGRALGLSLSKYASRNNSKKSKNPKAISFVSVGDGSVNHAHFLSATNLAEYAEYRGYKCPVVFAISDNDLAISLKGYGWLTKEFINKFRMKTFIADGNDMYDVYTTTQRCFDYSRENMKPSVIVYKNLTRRFGHAATDRQSAYLTNKEINKMASTNYLLLAAAQAVQYGLYSSLEEIAKVYQELWKNCRTQFTKAAIEPKVSNRQQMVERVSQPLADVKARATVKKGVEERDMLDEVRSKKDTKGLNIMRKHMTRVIDELMDKNKNLVYLGEDVVHGGYYLITENLAKKYSARVRDFPPEETCLLGSAIGYSQVGLLPICEIPYAKYLDCGADMFFELAISNWLSNGKQPNGMIIRLQGFDRGVFGGNFHTHNCLHLPPGIDVVCYSNGADYARGYRYCLEQAKKGRVVMTVDCTNLLNRRHISNTGISDNLLQTKYTESDDVLPWDNVLQYGKGKKLCIVGFGNGLVSAFQARGQLIRDNLLGKDDVTIIDCPYISDIPSGLVEALKPHENVVFVDVCKFGQNPFSYFTSKLHNDGDLDGKNWRLVAAPRTYNPLGSVVTFTSVEDIVEAAEKLLQ